MICRHHLVMTDTPPVSERPKNPRKRLHIATVEWNVVGNNSLFMET